MRASTRALSPDSVELRVHPEGGYGSDWPWGCVVTPKEGHPLTAWLTLAPRAPTREEIWAVADVLRSLGYTRVQWERIKNGQHRHTRAFRL